jgi:hypothetical protein
MYTWWCTIMTVSRPLMAKVHWEEALNLWPPRPAGWQTIDAGLPLSAGGASRGRVYH